MAGKKRPAEAPADAQQDSVDDQTSSSGSDDDFPEVAVQQHECLNGSQTLSIAQVSDEQEVSDEEEAGPSDELINVDFEFFDPAERDFHGIKTLLTPLFDGQPLSTSQLTEFILHQVPCVECT